MKGEVRYSNYPLPWKEYLTCYKVLRAYVLSYVQLFAPLFVGFSMQEYWSGLLFPSPEYLPDAETEPRSPEL